MTRIVLDPEQLAGAASDLSGAAGEYQAIGARVGSCECGCMPADVAATVDAATASIRSRLNGLGAGLVEESGELARRAGVPQDGGALSASAAWAGPAADGQSVVVGGGFDTSVFGGSGGGYNLVIGGVDYSADTGGGYNLVIGGTDYSADTGGGYNLVIGGTDFTADTGGGYTVNIGGTDWLSDTGGGYSLIIGGTDFSIPESTLGPGFDLTDWGLGGTGYSGRTLGSFTPTTIPESMAVITGFAARNNDWFTLSMLQNIQASMARTSGIWTLPEGWGYRYSAF
jgi:hypothetical protein